jgi:hypothetical protein
MSKPKEVAYNRAHGLPGMYPGRRFTGQDGILTAADKEGIYGTPRDLDQSDYEASGRDAEQDAEQQSYNQGEFDSTHNEIDVARLATEQAYREGVASTLTDQTPQEPAAIARRSYFPGIPSPDAPTPAHVSLQEVLAPYYRTPEQVTADTARDAVAAHVARFGPASGRAFAFGYLSQEILTSTTTTEARTIHTGLEQGLRR